MKVAIISLLLSSTFLLPARSDAQQSSNDPVAAQARSLGDIARKNQADKAAAAKANPDRPKDTKITTKRVFTDDDVKHGDPNQQPSTPQVNAPALKTSPDNVDITAKTPEQLGFDCFGKRQFSDASFASFWQQSLWTAHSALVDAAHDWNSNHSAAALNSKVAAQTAFTEAFGRCRAAVLANDKIEAWKASHVGDWYAPPKCTTTFGACDPARIK